LQQEDATLTDVELLRTAGEILNKIGLGALGSIDRRKHVAVARDFTLVRVPVGGYSLLDTKYDVSGPYICATNKKEANRSFHLR
jgi:hypothetical protein